MIGIYSIQSPSGKLYIGSSKNIEYRWKQYRWGSHKNKNTPIIRSLLKHGWINHSFQVIYECREEELLEKEQMLIDFYKPELNCQMIVSRPPSQKGKKRSEETKVKISEAVKARTTNVWTGRKHTEETKRKMSKAKKGAGG